MSAKKPIDVDAKQPVAKTSKGVPNPPAPPRPPKKLSREVISPLLNRSQVYGK